MGLTLAVSLTTPHKSICLEAAVLVQILFERQALYSTSIFVVIYDSINVCAIRIAISTRKAHRNANKRIENRNIATVSHESICSPLQCSLPRPLFFFSHSDLRQISSRSDLFSPPSLSSVMTSLAFCTAPSLLQRRHLLSSSFTTGRSSLSPNVVHESNGKFSRASSLRMVAQDTGASTTTTSVPATTPPASAIAIAQPISAQLVKSPPATFSAAATLGASKASQSISKVFLLSIIAGAYIALGGLLAVSVGGNVPALAEAFPGIQKFLLGAIGLPVGLTLVCTAGGELFTGNTALVTAAALSKQVGAKSLLKNWTVAYIGNFIGSVVVAALAVATACLAPAATAYVKAMAVAKCTMSFATALARGVACNWLVCLGVYLSNSASDFFGKFWAIWIAVSAFVALGFDHSVANMFFIPLGKMLGADVGIKAFLLRNLLPVTIGNVIGGAVLVAGAYWFAYGRK